MSSFSPKSRQRRSSLIPALYGGVAFLLHDDPLAVIAVHGLPRDEKQKLEAVAAGELAVHGAVEGRDDGARSEMLHSDLRELHVEPAFEHVGQREAFVVSMQMLDVRAFRLDTDHRSGELPAGEVADAEVANEVARRHGKELSLFAVTDVGAEHGLLPPILQE